MVVGLALPLLAAATTVPAAATDVAGASATDVAGALTEVRTQADVALDRLAQIVTAPVVRATPVPAPVAVLVMVLPAMLLAALAWSAGGLRRPVPWTLVRPDRVTAARRGCPSIAWRAPPTVD
jgi:hypothetical protein